jgi:hypothetical protein
MSPPNTTTMSKAALQVPQDFDDKIDFWLGRFERDFATKKEWKEALRRFFLRRGEDAYNYESDKETRECNIAGGFTACFAVRSFLQHHYKVAAGDIPLEVAVKIIAKYGLQVPDFMKEARIGVQEAQEEENTFFEHEDYGGNLSQFLMHKMYPNEDYSYVREEGEDSCYEDSETERRAAKDESESESESGSEDGEEEDDADSVGEPESKKRKFGNA